MNKIYLMLVIIMVAAGNVCNGQYVIVPNYCNTSGHLEMQKRDERAVGAIDITVRTMRAAPRDFYSSFYVIPKTLATVEEVAVKEARQQMANAEVARPYGYTYSNRIKIDGNSYLLHVRFTINSKVSGGVYCEAAQEFEITTPFGKHIDDSAAGLQYVVDFKTYKPFVNIVGKVSSGQP